MGCVLKSNSTTRYSAEVKNESEVIDLNSIFDEEYKRSYIIYFSCDLSETLFRFIKKILEFIYSNCEKNKTDKKFYENNNDFSNLFNCIDIQFCQKLYCESSFRILKEFLYFLNFSAKNKNENFEFQLKFDNILIYYKNSNIFDLNYINNFCVNNNTNKTCIINNNNKVNFEKSYLENNFHLKNMKYCYSLIFFKNFDLDFIKNFFVKFNIETLFLINSIGNYINTILESLGLDIINNLNKLGQFQCLIFPPIEFNSSVEINQLFDNFKKIFLVNEKQILKYLELQIKIKIGNYSKLKEFIDLLFSHLAKIENFAITFYFYNIKSNQTSKKCENILSLVYEKLKEKRFGFFFLKIFYILNENSQIEYKYYLFQENKDYLLKKPGGLNTSKILKTSLQLKDPKNMGIKIAMKERQFSNINYVEILFKFKLFEKIKQFKNIKKRINDFINNKPMQKSSTNTSNNYHSSNSNVPLDNFSVLSYKTNNSESYLIKTMKEFKIEKTSRKFSIDYKNPENFFKCYDDFYTELYKFS